MSGKDVRMNSQRTRDMVKKQFPLAYKLFESGYVEQCKNNMNLTIKDKELVNNIIAKMQEK